MAHDYLTVADVLGLHAILLQRYGGAPGVRDPGALEAALFRPQTGYYDDIIMEASALLESLAKNYPFVDGNKRVAFAAADVFLLPSLYDQMPNASLEAMACGLPLVVSSTSGTRDLIEDGREGYVRDWWRPSDWIGPISQCLASSESMGAQAHQTVLPYTFERMIQEWRQLYASLLPSS